MKSSTKLSAAVLATLCLASLGVALAQYAIDWHTIDGGGGTSVGGMYSVSGTIGQPDAGLPMSGGTYSLTGGFWAAFAIQTPGAPLLCIEAGGPGQATVSWTPDDAGWRLQEATSLVLGNWVDSASGPTNPVTVPVSAPTTFYRLFKP